ncbi:hypothetical protein [Streptomyces sp. UNOC14_S4]|uniref:hypothetical protein n=1 Tax=Streptomyces sp. UNOC14_S4 TaxID=2872340 RepID=UPI001E3D2F29|nr:hypothetical protein [Streptomyces sp. UNOC14_S4]
MPSLILVALSYGALCTVSPVGACRKCKGWGAKIHRSRTGRLRRGRTCRRCDGHGVRLRVGRRLYNAAARLYRENRESTR